ncbi:hypothetical protein J6590_021642 [Homalodisca vitripennis]|nr:hypothetical protein J6590_021642 [Homalodisca vitripennis]
MPNQQAANIDVFQAPFVSIISLISASDLAFVPLLKARPLIVIDTSRPPEMIYFRGVRATN